MGVVAIAAGALVLGARGGAAAAEPAGAVDRDAVERILELYVYDYASDPSLVESTFGIHVGAEQWHVVARAAAEAQPASVTLHDGAPPAPSWYFTIDGLEMLQKLDRGELNSETACVKAFSTDYAPMDMDVMEGFQPGPGFMMELLETSFHFWNRGLPEIIPFGEKHTRFTHGADAVIFYYQPGFRSGWVSMKPGQHANKDPRMQANEFPSLLIVTRGACRARIGGKEVVLSEGEAVLIPTGVTHEFWNDNERNMEGILLMFGEGA